MAAAAARASWPRWAISPTCGGSTRSPRFISSAGITCTRRACWSRADAEYLQRPVRRLPDHRVWVRPLRSPKRRDRRAVPGIAQRDGRVAGQAGATGAQHRGARKRLSESLLRQPQALHQVREGYRAAAGGRRALGERGGGQSLVDGAGLLAEVAPED